MIQSEESNEQGKVQQGQAVMRELALQILLDDIYVLIRTIPFLVNHLWRSIAKKSTIVSKAHFLPPQMSQGFGAIAIWPDALG